MATKAQSTGMHGVFLVAAELAKRGYVVSTTSRNAMGADLLVTDDRCARGGPGPLSHGDSWTGLAELRVDLIPEL